MEPLNVNPNAPLPPYVDSRLYIRAVTYGSGATSLFESWATEKFLIGMKDLYKPVSITSRSRPEFLHQFVRTCLRDKESPSPHLPRSLVCHETGKTLAKGVVVNIFWLIML